MLEVEQPSRLRRASLISEIYSEGLGPSGGMMGIRTGPEGGGAAAGAPGLKRRKLHALVPLSKCMFPIQIPPSGTPMIATT